MSHVMLVALSVLLCGSTWLQGETSKGFVELTTGDHVTEESGVQRVVVLTVAQGDKADTATVRRFVLLVLSGATEPGHVSGAGDVEFVPRSPDGSGTAIGAVIVRLASGRVYSFVVRTSGLAGPTATATVKAYEVKAITRLSAGRGTTHRDIVRTVLARQDAR